MTMVKVHKDEILRMIEQIEHLSRLDAFSSVLTLLVAMAIDAKVSKDLFLEQVGFAFDQYGHDGKYQ